MPAGSHHSTTIAPFVPLSSTSRSEIVARRLTDAIRLGLIGEGAQLPAEAQLAAQLGVATATLREALARLRRDGLIETRRGRAGGSFVLSPPVISLSRAREQLVRVSADELRDLSDFRIAVSGASAKLAASRGSQFEIQALKRTAAAATDPTRHDIRRIDSRFHIELAALSHSSRLTGAEISIQSEIGELLVLLEDNAESDRAASEHQAIVEALEAREANTACTLAENHAAADAERLIDLHIAVVAEANP
jgi:GntR family transcriptional regulator, transcriptional repressor for pyruvate dehydrogenase complex